MTEYIYLLKLARFNETNVDVYKIGRTCQQNYKRFNAAEYKDAVILFHMVSKDSKKAENDLKQIFSKKYKQRKDAGTESFEGNYMEMIKDIFKYIIQNDTENKEFILDDYDSVTTSSESEEDLIVNKKIETYGDFLKVTKIENIIIAMKDNKYELLYKYKNRFYTRIYADSVPLYESFKETRIFALEWISDLLYEKFIEHNSEQIFNDMFSNCLLQNVEIRKDFAYEYIFSSGNKELMFDAKKFVITKPALVPEIIIYGASQASNWCFEKYTTEEIKTDIVKNILSKISDKKTITKFKEFCKDIILCGDKDLIFYDYDSNLFLSKAIEYFCRGILSLYRKGYRTYFIYESMTDEDRLREVERNRQSVIFINSLICFHSEDEKYKNRKNSIRCRSCNYDKEICGNNIDLIDKEDNIVKEKIEICKKMCFKKIVICRNSKDVSKFRDLDIYLLKNVENIVKTYMWKDSGGISHQQMFVNSEYVFTESALFKNLLKWVCTE